MKKRAGLTGPVTLCCEAMPNYTVRRGDCSDYPDGAAGSYDILLGHLDPVSEIMGVQARLLNLGFDCGEITGSINERTESALLACQSRHGLKRTGEADDATCRELQSQHGS